MGRISDVSKDRHSISLEPEWSGMVMGKLLIWSWNFSWVFQSQNPLKWKLFLASVQ